jgi:hypothetical protein
MYSTDGTSWTEVNVVGNWKYVRWNGTKFCAVGTTTYATSTDGITWTTSNFTGSVFPVGMTVYGTTFYFIDGNVGALWTGSNL